MTLHLDPNLVHFGEPPFFTDTRTILHSSMGQKHGRFALRAVGVCPLFSARRKRRCARPPSETVSGCLVGVTRMVTNFYIILSWVASLTPNAWMKWPLGEFCRDRKRHEEVRGLGWRQDVNSVKDGGEGHAFGRVAIRSSNKETSQATTPWKKGTRPKSVGGSPCWNRPSSSSVELVQALRS